MLRVSRIAEGAAAQRHDHRPGEPADHLPLERPEGRLAAARRRWPRTGRPARRSTSSVGVDDPAAEQPRQLAGHGRLARAHHAGERDGLSGSERHRPPGRLLEVAHGVAAELLQERRRQLPGHHRLAHHRRGRHGADVAPLVAGLGRLAGVDVHRGRAASVMVGMGFMKARTRSGLAVGHAALEPAGPVGLPVEAALPASGRWRRGSGRRAGRPGCRRRSPPPGWPGCRRARRPAGRRGGGRGGRRCRARWAARSAQISKVPPMEPPRSRSRSTMARHRPPSASRRVDVERRRPRWRPAASAVGGRLAAVPSLADGDHPRARPSIPKRPRSCRASAPSATVAAVERALARSRASRASSKPYLSEAGQVGVAGPRPGEAAGRRAASGTDQILPVLVVLVPDDQRDGGAEWSAPPRIPERNWAAVGLDLHPAAAAVALLAAGQLGVHRARGRAAGRPGSPRRWRTAPGPWDSPAVR